jgi:hypothetical protein
MKLITNIICTFFIFYTQELNWVQNKKKKKTKQSTPHFSPKKNYCDVDKN